MSDGYSHQFFALCIQETFGDTKGVTKSCKSDGYTTKWPKETGKNKQ